MTSDGLQILDDAECYLLLHSRTLGRLGVNVDDQMSILPVYYAVMDRDIVFRTSPGTKFDAAVLGAPVVFEADNAVPGWSVLARGHAHEVRDPDVVTHARSRLGHDWPAGAREEYVMVAVEEITGRRFSQSA